METGFDEVTSSGYIHSSRVQFINTLSVVDLSKKYKSLKGWHVSSQEIFMDDVWMSSLLVYNKSNKCHKLVGSYFEIIKNKKRIYWKYDPVSKTFSGCHHTYTLYKEHGHLFAIRDCENSYDPSIYIVNEQGTVHEIPGSAFLIHGNTLVSEKHTDCGGDLVFFNLQTGKILKTIKGMVACDLMQIYYVSQQKLYFYNKPYPSDKENKLKEMHYLIELSGTVTKIKSPPTAKRVVKMFTQ